MLQVRRRAIVPGFHKRWLNRMVTLFNERATILVNDMEKKQGQVVDMEERFCSVTLDIIGKAVFNYDFGSVTKESPIVKAVYRVLREAESERQRDTPRQCDLGPLAAPVRFGDEVSYRLR